MKKKLCNSISRKNFCLAQPTICSLFIADILITISIFSPALCSAEMYENQIHRHESSSQRTSSSAMKKQLSNSTMHGSAGTEIIAKESSHQTYTRYVSKVNMLNA